jgi:NAD(P)-dependent dehydrogenase (short-subunit alcohol dehydrogenase family)
VETVVEVFLMVRRGDAGECRVHVGVALRVHRADKPRGGVVAAAKWAVEGYSEVLSKETAPLGIKVAIIEPGAFRTDGGGSSMQSAASAPTTTRPSAPSPVTCARGGDIALQK